MHSTHIGLVLMHFAAAFTGVTARAFDRREANSTTATPTATRSTSSNNATITGLTTGSDYASSCNSVKQIWQTNKGMSFVSNTTFITTTKLTTVTESSSYSNATILSPGAKPYVLCDGYTRINGHVQINQTFTEITSTMTTALTVTSMVSASAPKPTCIIGSSDCSTLYSSYNMSESAYLSYEFATPMPTQTVTAPDEPICGTPTSSAPSLVGPPGCAFDKATVQLLYWPVSTVSGDLCNKTGSTITATPSIPGQPNTFVTLDTTLTSPTVYLAVQGTYAITDSDNNVVRNVTQLLVPQSSTAVSSYCGQVDGSRGDPMSVNYNNFNDPVPASAYRCQPKCFNTPDVFTTTVTEHLNKLFFLKVETESTSSPAGENLCSTIYNDYAPALSIPPELKSIGIGQPMQGTNITCDFEFDDDGALLFDPPIKLQHVSTIQSATLPGATSTSGSVTGSSTSAQPVQSASPTTASNTSPVQSSSSSAGGPGQTESASASVSVSVSVPASASASTSSVVSTPQQSQTSQQTENTQQSQTDQETGNTQQSQTTQSQASNGENTKATDTAAVVAPSPSPSGSTDSDSDKPSNIQTKTVDNPTPSASNVETPGATRSSETDAPTSVVSTSSKTEFLVDPITAQVTSSADDNHSATGSGVSPVATTVKLGDSKTTVLVDPITAVVVSSATSTVTLSGGKSTVVVEPVTVAVNPTGSASSHSGETTYLVDPVTASMTESNPPAKTVQILTAAGTTFVAGGTSVVTLDSTVVLSPGGPAVTVSGETISLAPSGSQVIVDGTTEAPTMAVETVVPGSAPQTGSGVALQASSVLMFAMLAFGALLTSEII